MKMSCGLKSSDCRYLIDGSYACGAAPKGASRPPSGMIEGFTGDMVEKVKQVACQVMPGTSMCLPSDASGQGVNRS